MFKAITHKIFGTRNERYIKTKKHIIQRINDLESQYSKFSDEELRNQTGVFKEKIEKGMPLDDILSESFAVVREVSTRQLGERHYDVQLLGGMVLHEGKIAEMRTGEGKTLTSTLPVYLNALLGKGVHVVTVNEYLAQRDAEWMGKIYRSLGLDVGVILNNMSDKQRKNSYKADITYGINSEFGFDYLRDNMKLSLEDFVQRDHYFCIVDEVDSVLIDEARTPLIISGPTNQSIGDYAAANTAVQGLQKDLDYTVDEKAHSVALTDDGVTKVENKLNITNLFDSSNINWVHHINQGLKANILFRKDVDYVIKDGEIVIVDEFTGRLMPGRSWSDGLHQAIEAKEGVRIKQENQTLATITYQNYFRMYDKLAGMTGTADTEAMEFRKIYNLEVLCIPTNKTMVRKDHQDIIYRTAREKFNALADEIESLNREKKPILVGTGSIETSELVSKLLSKRRVRHEVLNAKNHAREADIILNAGQKGNVTIATNMAGRGTDIKLGQGVVDLGGLNILGTERHESRRIDNQLRGRAGRQGDPGSSRFYLSLEDDLMRIFAADRISGIMARLGMEEGEAIEHRMVTRAIENAQKRVEGHHFDIRKHLLEYDDVMNQQRKVIYKRRRSILNGEIIKPIVLEFIQFFADDLVVAHTPDQSRKETAFDWDIDAVIKNAKSELNLNLRKDEFPEHLNPESIKDHITNKCLEAYNEKEKQVGEEAFSQVERWVMLETVDGLWKDHLYTMDQLKEGIGLQGYAQRDPLIEYKKNSFDMFSDLIDRIEERASKMLVCMEPPRVADESDREIPSIEEGFIPPRRKKQEEELVYSDGASQGADKPQQPIKKKKIGRNEPCPCGSGKKYKKCCG